MKTIHFQSQTFSVPSWANYITQDADGYYVWELILGEYYSSDFGEYDD